MTEAETHIIRDDDTTCVLWFIGSWLVVYDKGTQSQRNPSAL